jgi:hypothetical protein
MLVVKKMFSRTALILLGLAGITGVSAIVQPQVVQPIGLDQASKANAPLSARPRFKSKRDQHLMISQETKPVLEAFQMCGCLIKGVGVCVGWHCAVGLVVENEQSTDHPYDPIRFYIAELMAGSGVSSEAFVNEAPPRLAYDDDRHRQLMKAYVNSSRMLQNYFCSNHQEKEKFIGTLCTDFAPLSNDEKKHIARRLMQASEIVAFTRPSDASDYAGDFFEMFEDHKITTDDGDQYMSAIDARLNAWGSCDGLYCLSEESGWDARRHPYWFDDSNCKTAGVKSCREQCPIFPTDPFRKGESVCRPQILAAPWELNHRRQAKNEFTTVKGSNWVLALDSGTPTTVHNIREWTKRYLQEKPTYSLSDDNCQKMVKFLLEAVTGEKFPMYQRVGMATLRGLGF